MHARGRRGPLATLPSPTRRVQFSTGAAKLFFGTENDAWTLRTQSIEQRTQEPRSRHAVNCVKECISGVVALEVFVKGLGLSSNSYDFLVVVTPSIPFP